MSRYRWGYGVAAVTALGVEIGIALGVNDRIVRPYGGDALAVVLVYLALRSATRLRVVGAIGAALAVAVSVELGQALHILRWIGLEHNGVARVVFGGQFDPIDFAAYTAGAATILVAERAREAQRLHR